MAGTEKPRIGLVAVNTISSEQLINKIIDGKNCVKVKDGKIKGVMSGNATVIFGYKAETTDGSGYVLYTQPVTIKIHINVPMCIAIVVAISVIIGVVAFAVMHTKKNKNRKVIPKEERRKAIEDENSEIGKGISCRTRGR